MIYKHKEVNIYVILHEINEIEKNKYFMIFWKYFSFYDFILFIINFNIQSINILIKHININNILKPLILILV